MNLKNAPVHIYAYKLPIIKDDKKCSEKWQCGRDALTILQGARSN